MSASEVSMPPSLFIEQVVTLFLLDLEYAGRKVRDGAKNALVYAAHGASDLGDKGIVRAINKEARNWIIPEGIEMPWGKFIKP